MFWCQCREEMSIFSIFPDCVISTLTGNVSHFSTIELTQDLKITLISAYLNKEQILC